MEYFVVFDLAAHVRSRAITLWLAFDDVDESNAAVHFIEGSHRACLRARQRTRKLILARGSSI